MTEIPLGTEVRLTRAALRQLPHLRTVSEVDDAMLYQIQKIVPARIAGFSEWTARAVPDVWVRWHWYFDDVLQDFVIPPQGLTTNIVLICEKTQVPLARATLYRMVMRRIRRRPDWQPIVRLPLRRDPLNTGRPLATLRAAALAPPIASRPVCRDGTSTWGMKIVGELAQLPEAQQFGRIARLAREKFGFNQTLAIARSPDDPADFVIEDNHLPAWSEAYSREQMALVDPRLNVRGGPTTWRAGDFDDLSAFWPAAAQHGVRSGWLMPSADGWSCFVLSRAADDTASLDLQLMEPNLVLLATFAHNMMKRRLASISASPRRNDDPLTDEEHAILRHIQTSKGRKEIAPLMGMSVSTLDRRIRALKERLGTRKQAHLVAVALNMGLLQEPDR